MRLCYPKDKIRIGEMEQGELGRTSVLLKSQCILMGAKKLVGFWPKRRDFHDSPKQVFVREKSPHFAATAILQPTTYQKSILPCIFSVLL